VAPGAFAFDAPQPVTTSARTRSRGASLSRLTFTAAEV
jgi:hypothetical protein